MARRYGEGSIYKTDDGRFRGAIVIDGKRRYVSGATRTEVRDALKALRRASDDGLPLGDARTTVADFLTRWISDVLPASDRVQSPNTIDNYKWALEGHVIPAIGHHKLKALTAEHVEKMLKDKAAGGMAKNSVMRLRSTLVTALAHAERRDLVGRNVARLAVMPAKTKEPKEGRSLTVEQAQALLAGAKGDRLEALYMAGLMLGLRPGELLGLQWCDLDLEAGTMQIRRTLKRHGGSVITFGEPKTKRSRRALTMPAQVTAAMRSHRQAQIAERLIAGPEWIEHDLVFCTVFGKPVDPSSLRRRFATLTKRAGLGHWHPHELRHSAASLLSAAGVPLEQIADVLGHDGTRMTARVYRHAVAPSVAAAVTPMEQMFQTG